MIWHHKQASLAILDQALQENFWTPKPSDTSSLTDWKKRTRLSIHLDGDIEDKTVDILEIMVAENEQNPRIFVKDNNLVQLVQVRGTFLIKYFDARSFRAFLSKHYRFTKTEKVPAAEKKDPKGQAEYREGPTDLPMAVVDNILQRRPFPFPEIEEVIHNPIYDEHGQIMLSEGYKPSIKAWLEKIEIDLKIPTYPSHEQIEAAKALILDDLLVDFPFTNEASKAHAVAMGLLPFVRRMIHSPTPMHMVTAPTPGSGKGLLVECMSLIATGDLPTIMTQKEREEEWRKNITSTLQDSPAFVMIDNLEGRIKSAALEAVLTRTDWNDRILGLTENASLRNVAVWAGTGNNPQLSKDLARRCAWVQLVPDTENPDERTSFKHKNIRGWIRQNRKEIMQAFLVLIQAWIVNGQQPGSKTLGSFEDWARIIGGILENAKIPGFLENREQLKDFSTQVDQEWRQLMDVWASESAQQYAQQGKGELYNDNEDLSPYEMDTADLYDLARRHDLLLEVLGSRNDASQKIRLGKALKKHNGRIFGQWRLISHRDKRLKKNLRKIENVKKKAE